MSTDTSKQLSEFDRAHPRAQELFWRRIRDHAEREHACEQALDRIYGPMHRPGYRPGLPRWDDTWRRRSRAYRTGDEIGFVDSNLEPQREWLKGLETEVYVERLTATEFIRGKALCPLPGHDERTPSFYVQRNNRWRCFGCGRRGDIYELGALLWGLGQSGPAFLDLHKRLMEQFG